MMDFNAHRRTVGRLMADWRAGQGARAANGVDEVMKSLEFAALPVAKETAWKETGEPVLLTRRAVRVAQHRAISQERLREFGQPPKNVEDWWSQIAGIAARWGIETRLADWQPAQPRLGDAPKEKPAPKRHAEQPSGTAYTREQVAAAIDWARRAA